jgi:predicted negative regulator of RcsB-dependent stress response
MEKVRNLVAKYPYLLAMAVIVLVCIAGYAIWHSHQAQPVTTESQVQAETPAGVTQAANKAQVGISPSQAREAASQIRYIYTNSIIPQYTIKTTGDKAQEAAEKAQAAAGADFAIVTNKSNPTETTDLKTLPAGSTVELNQYNVQAYKKVLHTIDVSPDIHNKAIGEVGYMVSRKISSDGKYLGVGVSYNVEDKKTLVHVSYTW